MTPSITTSHYERRNMKTKFNIRAIATFLLIENTATGQNYMWTSVPTADLEPKCAAVAAFSVKGTENPNYHLQEFGQVEKFREEYGVPPVVGTFEFNSETDAIENFDAKDYVDPSLTRDKLDDIPAELPMERFPDESDEKHPGMNKQEIPLWLGTHEIRATIDEDTLYIMVGDKMVVFSAPVPPMLLNMIGLEPLEPMFGLAMAAFHDPERFKGIKLIDLPFKNDTGDDFDERLMILNDYHQAAPLTFRQMHADELQKISDELAEAHPEALEPKKQEHVQHFDNDEAEATKH